MVDQERPAVAAPAPGTKASRAFDIRLIPEFHGSSADHTVSEWLEQVELVCDLCQVENVECIIPLRLRGGALAVYRRLTRVQRSNLERVKEALTTAFAPDQFVAYEKFVARRLQPKETVDEYLGGLQDLARLVDEHIPQRWLISAFVSGLPSDVKQQLRASARMDHMPLEQILTRARAIMTEETEAVEPVVAATRQRRILPQIPTDSPSSLPPRKGGMACYECGGPNHFARDCWQRRDVQRSSRTPRAQSEVRCYRCQRRGHIASECPGNEFGGERSAPLSPRTN